MDRLARNLGGRIPSCSQYWKCYNSSYNGIDWDDSWVVASKQHICCKTVSLVLVVTANHTVNVLVLWGVEIKNIHNFDEMWRTVPLLYKKKKSGRKTANIYTKKLKSFITVKAHCSMTQSKTAKINGSALEVVLHDYALYKSTFTLLYIWFILVLHMGHGCNI